MSETPPVIALKSIVTRFGDNVVHEDVNLTVERGEVVALIGGSGSGKTTLLRHIIGLTKPDSGSVCLFGEPLFSGDLEEQRARRRRFGVLFQQGALFSALNVGENVGFPLRELDVATEAEVKDLIAQKLMMVDLEPSQALLMPAELSGGMVKRVGLARALALEPELLLLDEPTSGLDPDRSVAFVQSIRSLHKQLDLTVLFVTHDLETLSSLATKVAVLADRRIVSYASVEDTKKSDHPFIHNFFFAGEDAQQPAESGGNS